MDATPLYTRITHYWSNSVRPFLSYLGPQIVKDRCVYLAAALTMASLLAMVPILTVTLSIYATFPAFQRLTGQVQGFVFRHFVPSTGTVVQQYLDRFVGQASRIQIVGMILFVVTAVLLIKAIDKAFNDIWQVKTGRPVMRTLLLYWTVLTLGPIVLGTSIGLSTYLTSSSVFSHAMTDFGLLRMFYSLIPMALSAIAFSLLYLTVPNRTVKVVHAVWGGIVAAVLLELAKRGFGVYVAWVPTYRLVFGAVAVLPLFLLWLYLSWMVVLLGAEIAHALPVFRFHHGPHRLDKFTLSYRLLGHLREAHLRGASLSRMALLELEPTLSEETVGEILDSLVKTGLVGILENGNYVLVRDLRTTTLAEFYRLLPWRLPSTTPPHSGGEIPDSESETPVSNYAQTLSKAARALDDALDIPLESLFQAK